MTLIGRPTNTVFHTHQEDQQAALSPGGRVGVFTAHQSLKYGDAVFLNPLSLRADKSLESSLYPAFFLGYVVGGTTTDQLAVTDSGLIGSTMSAAGEQVLVQTQGICYAMNDTTGTILGGQAIGPGRTTAGRVIGDLNYSVPTNNPSMAIKAGASALAKSVNVFGSLVIGVPSTATAANLDTAALSGTVANAKFGIYLFRVAADGTTVTSLKSADADTQAAIIWPTGSTTLITYGFVLINPTGTGGFVGGTTALDDATVVPNAKYYNIIRRVSNLGIALETVTGTAGAALKVYLP